MGGAAGCVCRVGDNGAVIWANRSTLELMGMAPEEFVGRSLAEFVETEDQERLREAMRRAFAGESLSAVSVRSPTRQPLL